MSAVAELVRQYLLMRAGQQELAQGQAMLALDDRALALHAVRQRTRLDAMEERHAVESRRAQAEAGLAAPRQAVFAAKQAIAVLLATTTPDAAWSQPVAAVPSAPEAIRLQQVPTDLLRFRPDVRLAEAEVTRAAGELGVARAEMYPRITLGLSYLYAYNITQNRRGTDAKIPAFGPMIDIPLFDWGRRRSAADAREEALDASLLGYRQALIEAYGETESALSGLARARERVDVLYGASRLNQAQLDLQAKRTRLGLASELDRLGAERALLQSDIELASARVASTQAFVLVYKTLGGAPLAQVAAGATP